MKPLRDFWNGMTNTSTLIDHIESLHAGNQERLSKYHLDAKPPHERAKLLEHYTTGRVANNKKNLPYALGRTLTLAINLTSPTRAGIATGMLHQHYDNWDLTHKDPEITPYQDNKHKRILLETARQNYQPDSTQLTHDNQQLPEEIPLYTTTRK